MNIIENVIRIMKEKGISVYKLEQDTGIRQQTFISWKKGTQPSADKIIKLIQYLEVSPNELFGYDPLTFLTDNDREMLTLFKKLPEREQIKFIGRLEDKVNNTNN